MVSGNRLLKRRRAVLSAAAAVLAIGGLTSGALAGPYSQYFFAWSNANADVTGINFAASPILNDANYQSVSNELALSESKGYPLSVRITSPLTPNGNAITQVLNKYKVQYVFLDLEGSNAASQTSTVVSQIHSTESSGAYIGNFNYYPNQTSDPTAPSTPSVSEYEHTGLNMANPALYPGSPDYRTPGASGNNHNVNAGGSTAPNIRSALFTLPIERLTTITNSFYGRSASLSDYNTSTYDPSFSPSGHTKSGLIIPWVTRFNNYGNAALTNEPGTKATPYIFNGTVDSTPADGQLLSRGDFSAQILDYRMRGADSVNMFLASVTDEYGNAYTETEQEQDVNAGWFVTNPSNGAALSGASVTNNIFNSNHYGFANLTSLVRLDVATTVKGKTEYLPASPTNSESTGVIWSGVYAEGSNNKPTLNSSQMSILLSNMSGTSHIVDLGTVAGYSVYDPNSPAADKSGFSIGAGTHFLLSFTLKTIDGTPVWDLASSNDNMVFTNNDRDGVGTPEPASFGLLGMAAFGLLARRRRPTAKV